MTIKQYLEKLKVSNTTEKSNHNDLDNFVVKTLLDYNKIYFKFSDLEFRNGEEILLNTTLISKIANCLGLVFIIEEEKERNICFANSSELRPEFRQNFTAIELLDYVYAFVHTAFYKEYQKIAITSEIDIFWKLVKIGSGLRKENK